MATNNKKKVKRKPTPAIVLPAPKKVKGKRIVA